VLFWLDKTYTLIFCVEMSVKMVALDVCWNEHVDTPEDQA